VKMSHKQPPAAKGKDYEWCTMVAGEESAEWHTVGAMCHACDADQREVRA